MPRNIEIKARVRDPEGLRRRARALSDKDVEVLLQVDTFYDVSNGRLKLRVLRPDSCELIYYERSDRVGAKESEYAIIRSDDPETFETILAAALPIRGVVAKTRSLYLVGRTRIHVDEVEQLGTFMEIEVVLSEGQTAEQGTKIAEELMRKLGVLEDDRVSGAYIDLLGEETRCS